MHYNSDCIKMAETDWGWNWQLPLGMKMKFGYLEVFHSEFSFIANFNNVQVFVWTFAYQIRWRKHSKNLNIGFLNVRFCTFPSNNLSCIQKKKLLHINQKIRVKIQERVNFWWRGIKAPHFKGKKLMNFKMNLKQYAIKLIP